MDDLEQVFSAGNQWHNRIFYDRKAGRYYDRATDVYLDLSELKAYGL